MSSYIDLPLYRRSKGVVAWAKVSSGDFSRVSKFKWYLMTNGNYLYARRVWYEDKKQRSIYLHCEILGFRQGFVVDHKNGDGLDCRRSNLRFVNRSVNRYNTARVRSDSKSGVKGVYWHTQNQCWVAYSKIGGKKIHLGCFDDLDEAGEVVKEFRLKYLPIHSKMA